jgi:hypothetical protein
MLSRVAGGRQKIFRHGLNQLHRLFLLGTVFVVWIEHRRVLEAAGYTFHQCKIETLNEFGSWNKLRQDSKKPAVVRGEPRMNTFTRAEPEA